MSLIPREQDLFPSGHGDFVIKTSNGTLHVHRLLLRLASPVFATLLENATQDGREPKRGHVNVSESTETFAALLSQLYPNMKPRAFTSLDTLSAVLQAAHKYQMEPVLSTVRLELINQRVVEGKLQPSFLSTKPLRVYAIAQTLGLTSIAQLAAEETLKLDLHNTASSPEIDAMPTSLYRALITLRKTRRRWLEHQSWTFPVKESHTVANANATANMNKLSPFIPVPPPRDNPSRQSFHPLIAQSSTLAEQPAQPAVAPVAPEIHRPIPIPIPARHETPPTIQAPGGCPHCSNWSTVVSNAKVYIFKRPALSSLKQYYTPHLPIDCSTCAEGLQRLLYDLAQKYQAIFPAPNRVE